MPVKGREVVRPADRTPGNASTFLRTSSKNAFRGVVSPYFDIGNMTDTVRTRLGSKPGLTLDRRTKLRSNNPDAATSTTANASSQVASALRKARWLIRL